MPIVLVHILPVELNSTEMQFKSAVTMVNEESTRILAPVLGRTLNEYIFVASLQIDDIVRVTVMRWTIIRV